MNQTPEQQPVDSQTQLPENSKNSSKTNRSATIGLVLGLISLIAWLLPLIGYPVTICGIVFSIKGLKTENRSQAIAGLILSIVFLLITLANSILGVLLYLNFSS